MATDDVYLGREQTAIKHEVLRQYLLQFALIIGRLRNITYVDCFSGPWNSEAEDLSDTSFSIAIQQFRSARERLAKENIKPKIRCLFLEKDKEAHDRLVQFGKTIEDVEVRTINAPFESSVDAILDYVDRGGRNSFAFFFVDPTGWAGIRVPTISPILKRQRSEVLVNFMTSHIRRWLGTEQDPYEDLFGSDRYTDRLEESSGDQRDDELLFSYCDAVMRESGSYVSSAVVLSPLRNRAHFHLVYATRELKGLEVFKKAERQAFRFMNTIRASAQQRARVERQGPELFSAEDLYDPTYVEGLRHRYETRARMRVAGALSRKRQMRYDEVLALWWRYPLTSEADLKDWIKASGYRIIGLGERERVPKLGSNHFIGIE